jgi:hypothetical protein
MDDLNYQQYKLDSMLRFAIICSIVWMMGIGSTYAFICGLRARKIIRQSNGALVGMGKAKWCLVVGGIGIAIWVPAIALIVLGNAMAVP